MLDVEEAELAFKQLPYYRTIVKSFIQKQIQLLLEEMCQEAGEESVIMTVNLQTGTMSHLGSEVGKAFLDDRKDLKTQFLSYCISNVNQSSSSNLSHNPPNNSQIQGKRRGGKRCHLNEPSAAASVTSRNTDKQPDDSCNSSKNRHHMNTEGPLFHVNTTNDHKDKLDVNRKSNSKTITETLHSCPEGNMTGLDHSDDSENTSGPDCEVHEQPVDCESTINRHTDSLASHLGRICHQLNTKKKSLEKKVNDDSNGSSINDHSSCEISQTDSRSQQLDQSTFLEIPIKLEEQILEENKNGVEEVTFYVKETPDGHIRIEPLENMELSAEQETSNSDLNACISIDDLDLSSSEEETEIIQTQSKCRNKFSISEKREIMEYKAKHPKIIQKDLAKYFTKKWGKRLTTTTVSDILSCKGKWVNAPAETSGVFRFRQGSTKFTDLEQKLCCWYSELQSRNVAISDAILVRKAEKLRKELGIQDFNYSSGWLTRFKKRNGIKVSKRTDKSSKDSDQTELSVQ